MGFFSKLFKKQEFHIQQAMEEDGLVEKPELLLQTVTSLEVTQAEIFELNLNHLSRTVNMEREKIKQLKRAECYNQELVALKNDMIKAAKDGKTSLAYKLNKNRTYDDNNTGLTWEDIKREFDGAFVNMIDGEAYFNWTDAGREEDDFEPLNTERLKSLIQELEDAANEIEENND